MEGIVGIAGDLYKVLWGSNMVLPSRTYGDYWGTCITFVVLANFDILTICMRLCHGS